MASNTKGTDEGWPTAPRHAHVAKTERRAAKRWIDLLGDQRKNYVPPNNFAAR